MGAFELGPFLVGVIGIAVGAPCLAEALVERPPPPLPRAVALTAAAWAVALVVTAAVLLDGMHEFGVFGVLIGAAEGMAAAAIWLFRGRAGRGGRGWRDPGEGGGPPVPQLPDEYWHTWEQSLAAGPRRRGG